MASKLFSPAFVIGLGGTGQWVLTYLKRNLLLSNNGKLPPDVHLLAIDTYAETGPSSSVRFYSQNKVELKPGAECFLIDRNFKKYFDKLPNIGQVSAHYPALELSKTIQSQFINLDRGAGASRVLGRLALLSELSSGPRSALFQLLQKRIDLLNRQADSKASLEILLVSSLHGGTGAGIYADLAALLHHLVRERNRQLTCRALLVLPDAMQGRKEDQARAFATWRELDRWMTLSENRPILFSLSPGGELQFQQDRPLFDECYLFGQPISSQQTPPQYDTFPMLADFLTVLLDREASAQLKYQVARYKKAEASSAPNYHSAGIYTLKKRSPAFQSAGWAKYSIRVFESLLQTSGNYKQQAQEQVQAWLDVHWPWSLDVEHLSQYLLSSDLETTFQRTDIFIQQFLKTSLVPVAYISQMLLPFNIEYFISSLEANESLFKPDEVLDRLRQWFRDPSGGMEDGLLPIQLKEIEVMLLVQFVHSLRDWLDSTLNTWHLRPRNGSVAALPFASEFLNQLANQVRQVQHAWSAVESDRKTQLQKHTLELNSLHDLGRTPSRQSKVTVEGFYWEFYNFSLATMIGNWATRCLSIIHDLEQEVVNWIDMLGGESRSGYPSLLKQLQAAVEYFAIQSNMEATVISSELYPQRDDDFPSRFMLSKTKDEVRWRVDVGEECMVDLFLRGKSKDAMITPDFRGKFSIGNNDSNLMAISHWVLQTQQPWRTENFPKPILEELSSSNLGELERKSAARIVYVKPYQPIRLKHICYPKTGAFAIAKLYGKLDVRELLMQVRLSNPNWIAWLTQDRDIDYTVIQERITAQTEYTHRFMGQLADPNLQPIYRQETNALYWEKRLSTGTSTRHPLSHILTELLENNQRFILFIKALLCDLVTYEAGWGYALALPNQAVRIQISSAGAGRGAFLSAAPSKLSELFDAIFTFTSRGHDIRTDRSSNRINYDDIEKELARIERNRTAWLKSIFDAPREHSRLRQLIEEINNSGDPTAQQNIAELLAIIELICQDWRVSLNTMVESTPGHKAISKIENFYVAGPPLTPEAGRLFVGRKEIFEQIRDTWNNPYRKQSIVLHGQRRMGKTSVLYQIRNHLGDQYLTVMVDFQGFAAEIESEKDLWQGLASRIHYEISVAGLIDDSIPPVSQIVSPSLFTNFLTAIEKRFNQEAWLVLMFDEYEKIPELIEQNRISHTFVDYLRSIIQSSKRTLVILAGHHELQDELKRYYSPLMNVAQNIRVSYLDDFEAEQLITNPWEGFQLEYASGVVSEIINACGGQPMLVQLVCRQIIIQVNKKLREKGTQARPIATMGDLFFVLNQIIQRREDDASTYFEAVRDWLSPDEFQVMEKLARLLLYEGAKEDVGRAGFSEADLKLVEELIRKDVLREENGHYLFRIELMRRWINRQTYN